MTVRTALALFAVLLLAGCGSSPKTHFFTLAAAPADPAGDRRPGRPVTVAAVHVPPSLDRREMVRRTGPNTVDIPGEERWTAPLGDMTRRILSKDLAARLAAGRLVPPDAPVPPRALQVVVAVVRFGMAPGGGTVLEGTWSLLEGDGGKPVRSRDFALADPGSPADAAAQAAAMSRLVGKLADRIAAALPAGR